MKNFEVILFYDKGGIAMYEYDKIDNIVPIWQKINLSIKEASEYSNIGVSTLRSLLQEKGCPFLLKIGNKHLIKRKEFEQYLKDKHYL